MSSIVVIFVGMEVRIAIETRCTSFKWGVGHILGLFLELVRDDLIVFLLPGVSKTAVNYVAAHQCVAFWQI